MKFADEWYAYNPSEVEYNPVDYVTIYNQGFKWHDNEKGGLMIRYLAR